MTGHWWRRHTKRHKVSRSPDWQVRPSHLALIMNGSQAEPNVGYVELLGMMNERRLVLTTCVSSTSTNSQIHCNHFKRHRVKRRNTKDSLNQNLCPRCHLRPPPCSLKVLLVDLFPQWCVCYLALQSSVLAPQLAQHSQPPPPLSILLFSHQDLIQKKSTLFGNVPWLSMNFSLVFRMVLWRQQRQNCRSGCLQRSNLSLRTIN